MADQPLASVVVTGVRRAEFLRVAIESALAQTYPRVEVVVVDDAATDDSRAVIAAFGRRVVPILEPYGAPAAALNAGFAASRGEVVLTLDADDALVRDAVARVVAAWRPGAAKVQFRLEVVDEEGRPRGVYLPDRRAAMPTGDLRDVVLDRFLYPSPPTSGNAYGRGALAEMLPVPEHEWGGATDAYLAAASPFYGPIISIDAALGYYRLNGDGGVGLGLEGLADEVGHLLQREALVVRLARAFDYPVPPHLALRDASCAAARLALHVLAPERDPGRPEWAAWLGARGLVAALRDPCGGLARRAALALWFLLVPALPTRAARPLALAALGREGGRLLASPSAARRRPAAREAGAGLAEQPAA